MKRHVMTIKRTIMNITHLPIHPLNIGAGFNADGIRGSNTVMDPYLMADHFWMTQPTFGPHPHAGFSAVTYLFADSQTQTHSYDTTRPDLGNNRNHHIIAPGDAHWFIAASGAVHDEPIAEPGKLLHGLQLFVNLAAADKFGTPRTLNIKHSDMPQHQQSSGAQVTLAWGKYDDGAHAMQGKAEHAPPTDSTLLDIALPAGASFHYPVAAGQTAMLIPAMGEITLADTTLKVHQAVAIDPVARSGGELTVSNAHTTLAAQFVLLLGTPLNEPVAQHGPFAMNTRAQLEDAIRRYQAGEMGRLN
jgi:redox-sensitive bicupin YhaK (pirin superfamily)